MTAAYALSLLFTLVYGYVAAYSPRAERKFAPLSDDEQHEQLGNQRFLLRHDQLEQCLPAIG